MKTVTYTFTTNNGAKEVTKTQGVVKIEIFDNGDKGYTLSDGKYISIDRNRSPELWGKGGKYLHLIDSMTTNFQ